MSSIIITLSGRANYGILDAFLTGVSLTSTNINLEADSSFLNRMPTPEKAQSTISTFGASVVAKILFVSTCRWRLVVSAYMRIMRYIQAVYYFTSQSRRFHRHHQLHHRKRSSYHFSFVPNLSAILSY
jgi:hypothetical protein